MIPAVSARLALLVTAIISLLVRAEAQEITIEKLPTQPRFTLENNSVIGLSGLTWAGGDVYYAVADHPKLLVLLTLAIDPATGCISRGEMGAPVPVNTAVDDFEGVAYVASTKSLYITSESDNAVIRVDHGGLVHPQPVPPIFAQARENLSLESITWNETAANFWIANEEALKPDGPLSGAKGTVVRLQKLDNRFRPVASYAWRTEPAAFRFQNSGSGVSDLCLLPDGRLIVLERGFIFGSLQVRLFLADFKGATDISKLPTLAYADIVPAKKTLLFQEATGFTNFEGITLGPELNDGSRSLILVADSNDSPVHTFLPLKIRFDAPATVRKASPKASESRPKTKDSQSGK